MSTTSTDKAKAIELMEKAVEKVGEVITAEKGDLVVKMKVGLSFDFEGKKKEELMGSVFPFFVAKGRFGDGGCRVESTDGAV
jgi:hypothetical protein